jgi:hypothetical protein
MKDIPCKNCLTFPICKSQAIDLSASRINLNYLTKKCNTFKEYCIRKECTRELIYATETLCLNICHPNYLKIVKFFTKGQRKERKRLLLSHRDVIQSTYFVNMLVCGEMKKIRKRIYS